MIPSCRYSSGAHEPSGTMPTGFSREPELFSLHLPALWTLQHLASSRFSLWTLFPRNITLSSLLWLSRVKMYHSRTIEDSLAKRINKHDCARMFLPAEPITFLSSPASGQSRALPPKDGENERERIQFRGYWIYQPLRVVDDFQQISIKIRFVRRQIILPSFFIHLAPFTPIQVKGIQTRDECYRRKEIQNLRILGG